MEHRHGVASYTQKCILANEEINLIENVYFKLAKNVIRANEMLTGTGVLGLRTILCSMALVRRKGFDIASRKTTRGAIVVILISHRRAYMWRI
jgi:hypothetical protein